MTNDEIWDRISKIKRDPCISTSIYKDFMVATNNPYIPDPVWKKRREKLLDYMKSNLLVEDKSYYLQYEGDGNMRVANIEDVKRDIWTALSPYGHIRSINTEYCAPPKIKIKFVYADPWNITNNISDALSAITYIEDAKLFFDAFDNASVDIEFNINVTIFDKERKNQMPPKTDRTIAYFTQWKFTSPIKKVMFNGPATIVYWADGTKTIVKCMEGEEFDPEKGLAMAICKRLYGGDFHRVFKDSLKNAETRKGNETKLARAARVVKAKKKKAKAKKVKNNG